MDYQYIKDTVRYVVRMLVEQGFDELYENDFEKRATAGELKVAIYEYGLCLTMPPSEAFDKIEIYETNSPGLTRIDFDLWSEGQISDITLCLAVYSRENEQSYSIEDIRML